MRHMVAQVLSKEFARNVYGCTLETCAYHKTRGTPWEVLHDNIESKDAGWHSNDGTHRIDSQPLHIRCGKARWNSLHRLYPDAETAS